MEKVLEEPSPENRNGSLRKATLWPPWMSFHHVHLLECPLLSQCLFNDSKPRCFALCCARWNWIFLSQEFSCCMNLLQNPILQTSEMFRHLLQSQRWVNCCSTNTSHCFKGGNHSLHLITVVPVSSFNLHTKKWNKVIYVNWTLIVTSTIVQNESLQHYFWKCWSNSKSGSSLSS